jgi:hypothetical protein
MPGQVNLNSYFTRDIQAPDYAAADSQRYSRMSHHQQSVMGLLKGAQDEYLEVAVENRHLRDQLALL